MFPENITKNEVTCGHVEKFAEFYMILNSVWLCDLQGAKRYNKYVILNKFIDFIC